MIQTVMREDNKNINETMKMIETKTEEVQGSTKSLTTTKNQIETKRTMKIDQTIGAEVEAGAGTPETTTITMTAATATTTTTTKETATRPNQPTMSLDNTTITIETTIAMTTTETMRNLIDRSRYIMINRS